MEPVYLDNAATTRIRPEVLEVMEPFLGEMFGNPNSTHRFGRAARAALEHARRTIAAVLGVEPRAVLFTSGGTESDNLAIIGAALAARSAGRPFRVAVSAIEHKAVIAAARTVEHWGGEAIVLPVDTRGRVELDSLDAALERGVAVASVMWVNNEVGVIQRVPQIAERCRAAQTAFHTDAVQALGKVPCHIDDLRVPLFTVSGHKIGAPKGIGVLVCREPDAIEPLLHGGDQQHGLRPGTENVCGAVGLAKAVELTADELTEAAMHTRTLRDDLERRIRVAVPDVVVNAADSNRAPHISNLSFPGTDSDSLLMHLDLAGIACSSGSACTTGAIEPSHVLTAMGVPVDLAIGSLRFSFGRQNTRADVDRVLDALPGIVGKVRKLSEALGR
jgi:cysteine desulfurase